MAEDNQLQVKTNVGDQVIARINTLCEAGFTMHKDYSYVNAIKMSMLKLQEVKDKNGRSALEVCTPQSIQTALFSMATKGLNLSLSQCYMIIRGNVLCIQESYFGKVLMVKRIYPDWNPNPVVIREGDVFEYAINAENGKKYIVKHEQKLENIDKDFIGGYMYLPTGDLYIMTRKQIMTAWSKSSNTSQTVHKQFDEKMITKTLISTGCNLIINSTPNYQIAEDENQVFENDTKPTEKYEDFEEAEVIEEVAEVVAEQVQENNQDDDF